MSQSDEKYLAEIREHAAQTRQLLSNAQKPERERMVVRAFLKCIGEPFTDSEVRASTAEPVDVVFRAAQFQVREILGGRKRGQDWKERQQRYEQAEHVSDLLEPWTSSAPMSLRATSMEIVKALAEKAAHYGAKNCATLDALVYVDLSGHHLWPLEPQQDSEVTAELDRQGWCSVSFIFAPYGVVLMAKPNAPDFLKDRVGFIQNEWPHLDGGFDA